MHASVGDNKSLHDNNFPGEGYEREVDTKGLTCLCSVCSDFIPQEDIEILHAYKTIMLTFYIFPLHHKRPNLKPVLTVFFPHCRIERPSNLHWFLTLQAERQFEVMRNQIEEYTSWCTSEAERIRGEVEAEAHNFDMTEREATETLEVYIFYMPFQVIFV